MTTRAAIAGRPLRRAPVTRALQRSPVRRRHRHGQARIAPSGRRQGRRRALMITSAEWLVAFSDDRSTLDDSTAKCRGTSVQYKDGSVGTGCTAATSPHQLSSLSKGRELVLCPSHSVLIDHRKWRRHARVRWRHHELATAAAPASARAAPVAPTPARASGEAMLSLAANCSGHWPSAYTS